MINIIELDSESKGFRAVPWAHSIGHLLLDRQSGSKQPCNRPAIAIRKLFSCLIRIYREILHLICPPSACGNAGIIPVHARPHAPVTGPDRNFDDLTC